MMNPVLRREAIVSLRGWKNYAVFTFYLLIMFIGAGLFFYASIYGSYDYSFEPQSIVILYGILAAIQMGLITLSVPALTAGSISGERERQTLDLLLITKMSPRSIVFGKLLSSMVFILLLIFSTLPIFSLVFYFGGVKISGLFTIIGFALTTAYMLGGISVFFSCIYKKTVVSIMLVYIIMGVLCFGTLLWTFLPFATRQQYYEPSVISILCKLIPNPGVGFASLIDTQLGSSLVSGAFFSYSNLTFTPITAWIVRNMWLVHICFQLIVGTAFAFLAAWHISPVREKKMKQKKKAKLGKKEKSEA